MAGKSGKSGKSLKRDLSFEYEIKITDNTGKVDSKIDLPNMKYHKYVLSNLRLLMDKTTYVVRISGKETIISISEAVLSKSKEISLDDKLSQIIDSDVISVNIKNTVINRNGIVNDNIIVVATYKYFEGFITYNQTYDNDMKDVLFDISKNGGKYIHKICLSVLKETETTTAMSAKSVKSVKFCLKPVFKCSKKLFDTIECNDIDMIITDKNIIDKLNLYTLDIHDNIKRIGVVVYGYNL